MKRNKAQMNNDVMYDMVNAMPVKKKKKGGFLGRLFTPAATDGKITNLILAFLPLMAVAAFASTPAMQKLHSRYAEKPVFRYGCIAAATVVMLLCVAALASQSYNPFIYFRF